MFTQIPGTRMPTYIHTGLFVRKEVCLLHRRNSETWLKHIEALSTSTASKNHVAVIHCRGHQQGDAELIKGNNKVDGTAKSVALEPVTWRPLLIPRKPDPCNYSPGYTKEELDTAPK